MGPPFAAMAALASLLLFSASANAFKVRVGHIGAVNAMPKAEAILEICRKELWKEGVLNDEFDLE